jgi:hypothetical protein
VSVEDAVVAVKRWFHGQTERSLVVLDSADAIDNGDDESYLNLEFSCRMRPISSGSSFTNKRRAAKKFFLNPIIPICSSRTERSAVSLPFLQDHEWQPHSVDSGGV